MGEQSTGADYLAARRETVRAVQSGLSHIDIEGRGGSQPHRLIAAVAGTAVLINMTDEQARALADELYRRLA